MNVSFDWGSDPQASFITSKCSFRSSASGGVDGKYSFFHSGGQIGQKKLFDYNLEKSGEHNNLVWFYMYLSDIIEGT